MESIVKCFLLLTKIIGIYFLKMLSSFLDLSSLRPLRWSVSKKFCVLAKDLAPNLSLMTFHTMTSDTLMSWAMALMGLIGFLATLVLRTLTSLAVVTEIGITDPASPAMFLLSLNVVFTLLIIFLDTLRAFTMSRTYISAWS